MNKIIFVFTFFIVAFLNVNAQQKISGTVVGADGMTMPGVSVVEKGTKNGTVTDANGKYSISVNENSVIIYSFMGYKTVEEAVKNRSVINITLSDDNIALADVVVTALGIKRSEKSLGYSVSEVNGEEITKARNPNVMNSLAGKVPGLNISQNAGGPAGSSKVLIRGNTTISGDNQPLYVIDGVPMINTNFGSVGSSQFAAGYDMGDVASTINPDDVASVSVLKGPSAAALYGSLASNGVIMITMKKGNKKSLGLEFNSSVTFDKQATKYDDVQTLYGQGRNGLAPSDVSTAQLTLYTGFGARLDPNVMAMGWDGQMHPYSLKTNNIDGFYQTGTTYTNSVAVSNATDNSSIRLSYTNLNSEDIVPNSGLIRNSFNLSAKTLVGKRLSIEPNLMYMTETVNNRPGLADSNDNIARTFIGLANNVSQSEFTNYQTPIGEYIEWGSDEYKYNPYWVINAMSNVSKKDHLLGSLSLNYKFSEWLNLKVTGSSDQSYFSFEKYSPVTSPRDKLGRLDQINNKTTTNQADAMLSFQKDITPDVNLTARLGVNYFNYEVAGFSNVFTNMIFRDVVSPNSYKEKLIDEKYLRKSKNSVYGIVAASFKNYLFLDATIRQDASSTLPTSHNIYSYPSLSGSFVFTEAFKKLPKFITFGKLRASAAEVGSDTDPYMLNLVYGSYAFPFNGQSAGSVATTIIPNTDLKPTRTRSFETGLAMKFLNNRVGFDFTYYNSASRDQINVVPAATTSGYASRIINVGTISNKGIELAISATPIEIKDFSWDVQLSFAKNSNNVESLADGLPFITLAESRWSGVSVVAQPGQPYGAIMGYNYQYAPDGSIILDKLTQLPLKSAKKEILGNGLPDWIGGLVNTVNYKGFSFSATIDIHQGGNLFSMTNMLSAASGRSNLTLEGRDEWILSEAARNAAGKTSAQWLASGDQKGYVPNGVINTAAAGAEPVYVQNTQGISPSTFWGSYAIDPKAGVATPFIYDASYVKLRDVSISYSFPKSLFSKLGVNNLSFGFIARNPWIIRKNVPNIDPDSNYSNGNGQGLELGSMPSRKSYGLNLRVKF